MNSSIFSKTKQYNLLPLAKKEMKIQFKNLIALFIIIFYSCDNRDVPVHIFHHQIQNVKNFASCVSKNDSIFSKNSPLDMTDYFSKCPDIQCLCVSEYKSLKVSSKPLKDFSKVTLYQNNITFNIKRERGYEEVFYHDLIFTRKTGTPPIAEKWDGHRGIKVEKIDSNLYYRIIHVFGF